MKRFKVLSVIALFPLLAFGCSTKNKTPNPTPHVEAGVKAPSTSTNDEEWSFYKNSKFGFSLSYPSDWVLEEHNESGSFIFLPKAFVENERSNVISIQAINVGRVSVFDTSDHVGTGTFAGKQAKIYTCPESVECYGDIAYEASYRLTELPKLWTKNNEINATVNRSHDDLVPVFQKIMSSITFSQ